MVYDFPPTEIRSNCRTSSDLPANLPALFTSTTWPCTSCPAGTTTSPSTARGESRVALKLCPGCAVSESSSSTRRMDRFVPDGMVTFRGGGGGAGVAGTAAGGADGAAGGKSCVRAVDGGGSADAISDGREGRGRGVLGRGVVTARG